MGVRRLWQGILKLSPGDRLVKKHWWCHRQEFLMYFIVPFIFLLVIVCVILLLVAGSLVIAAPKPKQNIRGRPSEVVTENNVVDGVRGMQKKNNSW